MTLHEFMNSKSDLLLP